MKNISDITVELTLNLVAKEGFEISSSGFFEPCPYVFYSKQYLDAYADDLLHIIYFMVQDPALFDSVVNHINEYFTAKEKMKLSAEQAS